MLRLEVSPHGPAWIGQRVTATLTAITPVRFAAPPTFPDLVPQGRAVVLPEGTTVPGTERVGGASFAALQHSYELFPAQAGTLVLPRLRMAARIGDGSEAAAEVGGLRIEVRAPPGAPDLSRLVVAPDFRVTASTDRAPEGLRAGEAITRSLRLEARDTAAMLLPVALWGRPGGVAVYPEPPRLQDRSDRGELRATREERAAYVPQGPGPVELPGFSFAWFEPGAGRMREVRVDPIRFVALPAAETAQPRSHVLYWLAGCLLILVLASLASIYRRWHLPAERVAFAALRDACRAAEPRPAFAALCRWRGTLPAPPRTASLQAETRLLKDRLYGRTPPASPWRGERLLRAARRARHALGHRRPTSRHDPPLPSLNP